MQSEAGRASAFFVVLDIAVDEIGHVVVKQGGALCGCGRRGCMEAYAGRGQMEVKAREETLTKNLETEKQLRKDDALAHKEHVEGENRCLNLLAAVADKATT